MSKRLLSLKYKIKKINNGWFKKGFSPWNKGLKGVQKISKETCKKMSESHKKHYKSNCNCSSCKTQRGKTKGENNPNFKHGETLKKHYCKICKVNEICYYTWKHGKGRCCSCSNKSKRFDEKFKKKRSKLTKSYWQIPEYRKKVIAKWMKSLQLKPNKSEKILNTLLKQILPKEYKYVGDGKVILGGFNPDFINVNGQKKIIELFGCYWHKCNLCGFGNGKRPIDAGRLKEYSKLGYSTLIVWGHELKDLDKIKNRILEFNKVGG